MRYLKIVLQPIMIKGDVEDFDVLQTDLYESLTSMIEAETLKFEVVEEEEDEEDF